MTLSSNAHLAVLVDADNAQAAVISEILAEVARYGTATVRRAYGDWTTPNLAGWKETGEQAVVVQEMVYGVPYVLAGLLLAFVSVRQSAVVVGVFWLVHGVYDLVHSQLFTNLGVPVWYPAFCFVIDAVVGAYTLWLSRRLPDANLRQPAGAP